MSRTVIREAMARLAAHGLVVTRQGSGVYVAMGAGFEAFQITEMDLNGVEDVTRLFELRLAIEPRWPCSPRHAGRTDIARLRSCLDAMAVQYDEVDGTIFGDVEFHRAIARRCGKPIFRALHRVSVRAIGAISKDRITLSNDAKQLQSAHRYLERA